MLETIVLPGSGRITTRIGFGGSGLMGGISEKQSRHLLEIAYDCGIRHFDVAPSYGHGLAEQCLGKFLRGKSDQVTVATKYGILPPPRAHLLGIARQLVRPIAMHLPSIRRRLAQAAAGLKTKAHFSAEEAHRSIEHSLRQLGLESIDLWLLHEATADDLDHTHLLPILENLQQQGRIGAFGLGTARIHLEALRQRHPAYCRVLQYESSVLDSKTNFRGAFCIHHRAISGALSTLQQSFQRDSTLCRRWSEALDTNLADNQILSALLLSAALAANPGSMVLFSSRNPAHIISNLKLAYDPTQPARAQQFLQLIETDRTALRS